VNISIFRPTEMVYNQVFAGYGKISAMVQGGLGQTICSLLLMPYPSFNINGVLSIRRHPLSSDCQNIMLWQPVIFILSTIQTHDSLITAFLS
jgi:hypothetical protein